jgi:hypothetical protein
MVVERDAHMTSAHGADDLRAIIRSGALSGEALSRAVIRLYWLERGAPVEYIEVIENAATGKIVSQTLRTYP